VRKPHRQHALGAVPRVSAPVQASREAAQPPGLPLVLRIGDVSYGLAQDSDGNKVTPCPRKGLESEWALHDLLAEQEFGPPMSCEEMMAALKISNQRSALITTFRTHTGAGAARKEQCHGRLQTESGTAHSSCCRRSVSRCSFPSPGFFTDCGRPASERLPARSCRSNNSSLEP
jgi:hypothetical protein